jgi:hypothetical protein
VESEDAFGLPALNITHTTASSSSPLREHFLGCTCRNRPCLALPCLALPERTKVKIASPRLMFPVFTFCAAGISHASDCEPACHMLA